jgi:hypothetical protein
MGLTVKVGSSMAVDAVADSTAEEASVATLETAELASLRTDCASALTDPASRAAAERAAVEWKRMAGASREQPEGRRIRRVGELLREACCFQ